MIYRFATCKPSGAPGSARTNDAIFARPCLGIELTEPDLAARCVLGNIDPQHTDRRTDLSAIRASLVLPLPPPGATLVTLKPDADALGAMALIMLRAQGATFAPPSMARIAHVDVADRFAHGPWRGPRPLPETLADIDEVGYGPEGLGAMIVLAADSARSLDDRIEAFARWIATGSVPQDAAQKARSATAELHAALIGGLAELRALHFRQIAHVHGAAIMGAMRLGYRTAPIVIAENPRATAFGAGPHRRVVIAQYDESHADFAQLTKALASRELGWGGGPCIIGSPQGVATDLPLDILVRLVLDSLRKSALYY